MVKPVVWATLLLLLTTTPLALASVTIDPNVEIQAGPGVFTFATQQNATSLDVGADASVIYDVVGSDGLFFDVLGFIAASGSSFNVTSIQQYNVTLTTLGPSTGLYTPSRTASNVTGSTLWAQVLSITNATSPAATLSYLYEDAPYAAGSWLWLVLGAAGLLFFAATRRR